MNIVKHGLVIPRITFVGEIIDDNEEDTDRCYMPEYKRYYFFVKLGESIQRVEDDDRNRLNATRNDIIIGIEDYYTKSARSAEPKYLSRREARDGG